MRSFAWVQHLWRNLVHRPDVEQDLDDELNAYVGELAAEQMRRGLSPTEARRAALVEAGGVQQVKENVRDVRSGASIEGLLTDLRITGRSLRRTPGFTTVAIVTLALGIGANTALFSVADEVFLKSLPVRNPDQLVLLGWTSGPRWVGGTVVAGGIRIDPVTGVQRSSSFQKLAFDRFKGTQTLSSVFAFSGMLRMTASDSQSVQVQLVSGNYFTGLGVNPGAGRLFSADDDREGAPPVAVISDRYWQRRFGRDPAAVGRPITLGTTSSTIIGVTPAAFAGTQQLGSVPDVSFPLVMSRALREFGGKAGGNLDTPRLWSLRVMGRLRAGASSDQVRAELQGPFAASALEGWNASSRRTGTPDIPRLEVTPGGKGLVDARRALTQVVRIMAVVVAIVLLIVCTNLANLLLARAASRQRELAVRTALGAQRARLVRQFLVESAVLSFAGGALGVLLAYWGKDLFLVWINRTGQSYVLEPKLDLRVLAFTASVALLTAMVVGLFPALKATRVHLTPSMREGSASALPRSYVSRTLMVAQVAMSVVLLVGAGLFVRTLRNLRHADVGFDRTNLLLFEAGIRRGGSGPGNNTAALALYDEVTRRLAAIPGVRAATFSEYALLSGDLAMPYLYAPGRTPPSGEDPTVFIQSVHPAFFETMGMPLVAGRTLTDRDARAHARVAVVNEALVRRYFPDGSALGRRIGVTKDQTLSAMPDSELMEIVGVVRDAKFSSVRQDIPITMFRPMDNASPVTFEVRTSIDPMGLAPSIRAAVTAIDRSLTADDFRSQEAAAERSFAEERHFAFLTSLFGLLAALLACLGLYGLVSYHVTRRTHEIGVRMALGAQRGRVVGMVIRETLAMAAAGVVIGLLTASGLTRFIASLLFGLPRNDASTLGTAALLMLAVAAAAGLLPGWRAANVDPTVALRHE